MNCTSCRDDLRPTAGFYAPGDKCPECAWELSTGRIPPPAWPEDKEPLRYRVPARQRLRKALEEPSPWNENAVRALEDGRED